MKSKRHLLIGLILSALTGWALGFLRLPYLEKNNSFWLGIITCLACVSLGLFVLFVWNKHPLLLRLIGEGSAAAGPKMVRSSYAFIWKWVSVFIVSGGLVSSFLIFKQNAVFKMQTRHQETLIARQSAMLDSIRSSGMASLMSNVLENVDDELKHSPERSLSDATIDRIAALSFSLKPYSYFEGDTLSEKKFSPERGQLLMALVTMEIDSSSFDKIMNKASFAGADMSGADLKGVNLRRANLRGANLKDVDLSWAYLTGADLREANLWGANLSDALLSGANLKRATLSWAVLTGADLDGAELEEADLTDAKLRKANLSRVILKWADLSGAILGEANLKHADLTGANLSRTNMSNTILEESVLTLTNLKEANLSGAELNKSTIYEEDWIAKLNKWQVGGAKEIQERYEVVKDPSSPTNLRLERIED